MHTEHCRKWRMDCHWPSYVPRKWQITLWFNIDMICFGVCTWRKRVCGWRYIYIKHRLTHWKRFGRMSRKTLQRNGLVGQQFLAFNPVNRDFVIILWSMWRCVIQTFFVHIDHVVITETAGDLGAVNVKHAQPIVIAHARDVRQRKRNIPLAFINNSNVWPNSKLIDNVESKGD